MVNEPDVRLLVLTDMHYIPASDGEVDFSPRCKATLGAELVRRTVADAARQGGFDCVLLLGDLHDCGAGEAAEAAVLELRRQIEQAAPGAPVLAVPGNHDFDMEIFTKVLGSPPGLHEVRGSGGGACRLVLFADPHGAGNRCTRSEEDRELLRRASSETGPPIVVAQHTPVNPAIDSYFPPLLTNRAEVMADYAACGVAISLGAHCHAGGPMCEIDGVKYLAVPALCESPFRYVLVSLCGRQVFVETRALACCGPPPLADWHAHTEFAYCGRGITARRVIERARNFGLAGQCLVEHAGQLYCRAEDFWQAEHVHRPAAWREGEHSRMREFREAMSPLRSGFVRVGLEVELDANGDLTVRSEDRAWADVLVGAIHWLPARDFESLSDAEFAAAFMRANDRMLAAGIDILAHPWRVFRRTGRGVPGELYGPLAEMLAATGTAVELNFHVNEPDERFFAACIERGVKVAPASDAHEPWEAGGLTAHVSFIGRAAVGRDVGELLLPWR